MSRYPSTLPIITTAGTLDLQETTQVKSKTELKRGDFVLLKVTKPKDAEPYGYAEVLAIKNGQYKIRRFN